MIFCMARTRVRSPPANISGWVATFSKKTGAQKPKASEVLTGYLTQTSQPPWTSYFVKLSDVTNDQYGMSYFNWEVNRCNYHILRVGCWPYIKYHCTKASKMNLDYEDKFYRAIKVANLGIPCLIYGVVAHFLITHKEVVCLEKGNVFIYFLIKENIGSFH